jgi:hypothetical protein
MSTGYERYALILDTERGSLGRIAMQLVEMGVDALYANDLDEADLLARQEASKLGTIVIPADTPPDRVERVLKRICSQLRTGAESLVMCGDEPAPAIRNELRSRGAKWSLWTPYTDRELRFVMASALATGHRADPRDGLRIPTEIEAVACMGRHRKDVVVHNLSSGGAYLATRQPFLLDSLVSIDIPLPGFDLLAKARVVSTKAPEVEDRPDVPPGMGVQFETMDFEAERKVIGFIADWVTRFWV